MDAIPELVRDVFAAFGALVLLAFAFLFGWVSIGFRKEKRARKKPLPDVDAIPDEAWDRLLADLEAWDEKAADVHDVFPEEGDRG